LDIGVPREIKTHEYRVGLVPASVAELCRQGHRLFVETGAGAGIGAGDEDYRKAGAAILGSAPEVFAAAELIVKVKEPQPAEIALIRSGQILFTYLHLAADPPQADGLIARGAVAIAYETVTDARGGLPLLAPMSEVAGRMAVQVGAHYLEKPEGGAGVLLGGTPGVPPGTVVVLGAGVVGTAAARIAMGLGARVVVLNKGTERLGDLDRLFGGRLTTVISTATAIESWVPEADLLIGAVLVAGAQAPKLVSRAVLRRMRPGSVAVDVAIDQGGCFETSRPTTHAAPTYLEEGVIHYCVTNMPGAVARTSALALNNETLPFVAALAAKGWRRAVAEDAHLRAGLNICRGAVTHPAVAAALGRPYRPAGEFLETAD
jgi:alanine dehydrogenase